MEEKKEQSARRFRGKEVILKLLREQVESGQNIKSFCVAHGIAEGTFHNWRHKYDLGEAVSPRGFATLQVTAESGLFAMVGNIKIYQPVSAAYLKELLS